MKNLGQPDDLLVSQRACLAHRRWYRQLRLSGCVSLRRARRRQMTFTSSRTCDESVGRGDFYGPRPPQRPAPAPDIAAGQST